jgi:hypothetical protein
MKITNFLLSCATLSALSATASAATIIRGFENFTQGAYSSISYDEFTVTPTSPGGDLRVYQFVEYAVEGTQFLCATKSTQTNTPADGNVDFEAAPNYALNGFSVNGIEASNGRIVAAVNLFAAGGASLGSFNILAPGDGYTPVTYAFADYTPTSVAKFQITNINDEGGFAIDRIVVSAVPEPSALALLGLSTLGLIARRRRTA